MNTERAGLHGEQDARHLMLAAPRSGASADEPVSWAPDFDVPDLSLPKEHLDDLRRASCAAHIVLLTDPRSHVDVHPAVRRSIAAKLVGRAPVTVFEEDRVEISFDVEDLSDDTQAVVGGFARALGAIVGTHVLGVRHRLLHVPASDHGLPQDGAK